ncbi:MAG: TIGR01777 family oxidoreductase [Anaerolineaceae bacterium]
MVRRTTVTHHPQPDSSRQGAGGSHQAGFQTAGCVDTGFCIGYYGTERKTALDETSGPGRDALAEICVQWESSTAEVESMGVRRIIIRTGLVLERDRGVLPRMMLPFRFFAGGPLGAGNQVLSWIHLEDELAAILFLLNNPTASGAYNLTAPAPATNREFGKTLAGVMKRPFWLPVPDFALKILLGRQTELVLEGQQVQPRRLLEAGFSFKHPELKAALKEIIG